MGKISICFLLFKVIIIMIFYIYLLILLDDSVYAHLNSSVYMCIYIGIYIWMYIWGVVYTSIRPYVYIYIYICSYENIHGCGVWMFFIFTSLSFH